MKPLRTGILRSKIFMHSVGRSFSLLLGIVASITVAQTPAHAIPDLVAIKDLALAKNFDELESQLGAYEAAYRKDPKAETDHVLSYEAFSLNDPRLADALGAWITAKPQSAAAHLAMGIFLNAEAWRARGGKFIDKTSNRQISGMEHYFGESKPELKKAIALNPRFDLAILHLLKRETAMGDDAQQKLLFEEALRFNPAFFSVYWARMHQLKPRWGGSYQAMAALIAQGQKYVDKNPRLKELQGAVEHDQGTLLWESKQYQQSLPLLTKAIELGAHYYSYIDRAWSREKLNDIEGAIGDYSSALSVRPDELRALKRRGILLYRQGRYEEALRDLDRASLLEPGDENNVFERGNVYRKLGQLDKAEADYTEAIRINPQDAWQWKVRARLYREKNELQKAYDDGKRSLELKPTDVSTWYEHASTLHRMNKHQEMVAAAQKILEIGNPHNAKDQEAIGWANSTLNVARAKGML